MALEPRQDELLGPIVDGPTLDADTLRATGALTESSADVTPELDGTETRGSGVPRQSLVP